MLKQINLFRLMAEEKTGGRLKIGRFFTAQNSLFSFSNLTKPFSLILTLAVLSACGDLQIPGSVSRQDVRLSPVQACAIGYDLASQIYARLVLEETIIIPRARGRAGARPGDCEAHTLTYLKRAGFKIDETAPGPAMAVDLSAGADGSVGAIATISLGGAGSLRLGRSYRLAETGVYPQGAVSFITLPKGAKARRSRGIFSRPQRGDQ